MFNREDTMLSRRTALLLAGGAVAATVMPNLLLAEERSLPKKRSEDFFVAKDGARIFYKDWGHGQPIVFSHGWPLSADAWDGQMLFLAQHGYRVIAHDRRSHGRSEQTWYNNTMNQYASDLAELLELLDIRDAVLIGHSTGGGEVARYIGLFGSSRVAKAALISSVPPIMLKSADNPDGTPIEVFDAIRKGVKDNRAQYYIDLALPFYGYNRADAKVSDGVKDSFWRQGMIGGIAGQYDCVREFSEVNFTDDLKKMRMPTLVIQGDDDQIVPYKDASLKQAKLLPNATLKIYPGAPHGLPTTHQAELNDDLLAFIAAPKKI